jgi:hypothetical protein
MLPHVGGYQRWTRLQRLCGSGDTEKACDQNGK